MGDRETYQTPSGLLYNPMGNCYYQIVLPIWRQYQEASYIGTTGDLYTLLSKETPRYYLPPKLPNWDYSKPTIPSNYLESLRSTKGITFDQFEKILQRPVWFDRVTQFVRDTPGLIMAGGYVVKAYLSLLTAGSCSDCKKECQDLDLFLTGPAAASPQAAKEIAMKLERLLIEYSSLNASLYGYTSPTYFSMARTSNCINFFLADGEDTGGNIAQLILRLYDHPSEVLHSFDLGSCQLAYDGEELFTTSAGLLAMKMGINIVDMKRRRRTYEGRLAKYYQRGFGIVFPNLLPASLEKTKIQSRYFIIHSETVYSTISVKFKALIAGNSLDGEEYSGMIESYQIQIDDSKVTKHNITNYIRYKSHQIQPYYLIKVSGRDLSDDPQVERIGIDSGMICNDQRMLRLASRTNHYNQIIRGIHSGVFDQMKMQEMKNYLTPEIIQMVINLTTNTSPHLAYEMETEIGQEIKALKQEVETNLPKITIPLVWKSVGDGNDLNASFGMERVPIQDWYGDHYLPQGWDPTKTKYYPTELRDQIKTLMLIRGRSESPIHFLPMELVFYIFQYLTPR